MADSGSDLEHLTRETEQGRPARDVLRGIWLEAIAALRRAISRLP
jgi:hypothetical protein